MTYALHSPLAHTLTARATGRLAPLAQAKAADGPQAQTQDSPSPAESWRLLFLLAVFMGLFLCVAVHMGRLAVSEPPPRQGRAATPISGQRADIVDRNGRIFATNIAGSSLHADPWMMIDKTRVAQALAAIFPDLDPQALMDDFNSEKKRYVTIKRRISPEQMQAVHEIGDPGLGFGKRSLRLYPNGAMAAHVLGGVRFGEEGVTGAELIGRAGVEQHQNDWLSDATNKGGALKLSLDMTVQGVIERLLQSSIATTFKAKGAAAVLMDVHSGEILTLASLPGFDPNQDWQPAQPGASASAPRFNRAAQGVYELGSVFKIFTAAQAMELDLVRPDSLIDTSPPMRLHGHAIGEYQNKNYGVLSVADIIVKSSNRGAAQLALQIGAARQQQFLHSLGMFVPLPLEMPEAASAKPLFPKRWTDLSAVTISYGHGLSVTPVHLAAGYATLANGGYRVSPTLLHQNDASRRGPRVLRADVAAAAVAMLRGVVTHGTAQMADVAGYAVAGKTGTADKPHPNGGYYPDKMINSFAAIFPATQPQYVLVVVLDEPVYDSPREPRNSAGWTAAPLAAEIIHRIAPLLGMKPEADAPPAAPPSEGRSKKLVAFDASADQE